MKLEPTTPQFLVTHSTAEPLHSSFDKMAFILCTMLLYYLFLTKAEQNNSIFLEGINPLYSGNP